MATHAQNIANLRNAVYGEQVRGSMIELFEEDYNLVKDGVGVGTDVSSSASSTTGYSDGAVYINNSTWHLFKLEGTAWADKGIIQGTQGESVTGAVDNGDGTFYLTLSDGSRTGDIATIQGIQGPQGPQGPAGSTGPAGRSVSSITMSGTGKSHPITATYSDGSTETVGVVQDGADGSGTGDMSKSTYDPNNHGYVDAAAGVTNGTNTLSYSTLNGKANAATSLAGYGITDAYTKTETDGKYMGLPASSVTSGKVATSDGSGGFTWATPASGVTTYAALTDTDVTGAAAGSYMKYDNTNSKWVVDNDLKLKVANLTTASTIAYINVTGTPVVGTTSGTIAAGDHTHVANILQIADSSIINENLKAGKCYQITAGGNSIKIKTPEATWSSPSYVQSDGTVTFTGLDDDLVYDLYYELATGDNEVSYSKVTKSGTGSSVQLVFTTNAPNGTKCKLKTVTM